MFGIGLPEIILLLMLLVIVFGANRLPEIGRSLGEAMRERKKEGESDTPVGESSEETR